MKKSKFRNTGLWIILCIFLSIIVSFGAVYTSATETETMGSDTADTSQEIQTESTTESATENATESETEDVCSTLGHDPDENGACQRQGCGYRYKYKIENEFYDSYEEWGTIPELNGKTVTLLANVTERVIYVPQGATLEAMDGVEANVGQLNNYGTVKGGTYIATESINNSGTIESGTFTAIDRIGIYGEIEDGTFSTMNIFIDGGTVKNGSFTAEGFIDIKAGSVVENGSFTSKGWITLHEGSNIADAAFEAPDDIHIHTT
ncbi:MAG: hypothetical protein IJC64_02365, partial [Clostridia bacterium]|nr:hypothetical protein [Clostridia bacterium]